MRQARREVARSQCKLLKELSRVFVADEVLFIRSEKRVDQKLRNASHFGRRTAVVGRSRGATFLVVLPRQPFELGPSSYREGPLCPLESGSMRLRSPTVPTRTFP